jgi:hypothetical protein
VIWTRGRGEKEGKREGDMDKRKGRAARGERMKRLRGRVNKRRREHGSKMSDKEKGA